MRKTQHLHHYWYDNKEDTFTDGGSDKPQSQHITAPEFSNFQSTEGCQNMGLIMMLIVGLITRRILETVQIAKTMH